MNKQFRFVIAQIAVITTGLLWLLSGCGGGNEQLGDSQTPTFGSPTMTFSSASPSTSPSAAGCSTTVSNPNPVPNLQVAITIEGPSNTDFTAVANYRDSTSSSTGTTNGSGVANVTFNSGTVNDAGFVVVVNITFTGASESCQATWRVNGQG